MLSVARIGHASYKPLVPEGVLRDLLFSSKNPETGAKEEGFAYASKDIKTVLTLAKSEKEDIEGLKGFVRPVYIASAGGPGNGKSTALFQYVAALFDVEVPEKNWLEPSLSKAMGKVFSEVPAALVSPDRRGILSLAMEKRREPTSDRAFYLKWRWASNFLSNIAMNVAFNNRRNIVHDTTMSGGSVLDNLKALKESDYCIAVLMQGAEGATRQKACDKRNKIFFQSLDANITAQDAAFSEKIPHIVSWADLVVVGWRDKVDENSRHVAKIADGKLLVLDEEGFNNYCAAYPAMGEVRKKLEIVSETEFKDPLIPVVKDIASEKAVRRKPFFPQNKL
ncbi:MAG: hypothetical protein PHW76_04490 [Alphaproteobacteria bacterium]|nr:hypothetical protein [Alphaproteobacteria bacterium]